MTAPASNPARQTISLNGFSDLVIRNLQKVDGVRTSDLESTVRQYFGPLRGQERMTIPELNSVIQRVHEQLARTQNPKVRYADSAKDAASSVAHAFAEAVRQTVQSPAAAEPVAEVKKIAPARPNVPRSADMAASAQPTMSAPPTPTAPLPRPAEQPRSARTAPSSTVYAARAPKPPKPPKPLKQKPLQQPEGWLGMIKATRTLRTSPDMVRKQWEPLISAAEQCAPDSVGIRTVPCGDTTVRMLLGGVKKPTWCMHPDDVNGPLREAINESKQQRRAERWPNAGNAKPKTSALLPPADWVGMIKAAQRLHISPGMITSTWKPLVEAAQTCVPDEQGMRTVPLGDHSVRMLFGGPRKPTWYMHPQDVDGPLRTTIDAQRQKNFVQRWTDSDNGRANSFQPSEHWIGSVKATKMIHTSPAVLARTWKPLIEVAKTCVPDEQGIRTVPLGDTTVRMMLAGSRKQNWYMHIDDAHGALRTAIHEEVKQRFAERWPNAGEAKPAPLLPPDDWVAMIKATELTHTSPAVIGRTWKPLIAVAQTCEPDAQGVRTVPLGETTVRMMFAGARKPSWYMHPDDAAGALRDAIQSEKQQRRSSSSSSGSSVGSTYKPRHGVAPEGYLHYSAMLHKIGGDVADIKIVWNALKFEAERHPAGEDGIVEFVQKEGTVRMWQGGRANSWHIAPESFEDVFLPRYKANKIGLHTDRVKHTLIAAESAPRQRRGDDEEDVTSLSHMGRVKPRKDAPVRSYEIDEQSKFEISAVIDRTVAGFAGRVPPSVEDRLRLEMNRAFSDFKDGSVVTKANIVSVIAQCKENDKNGELTRESREVYRVVANALEGVLDKLNTIAPVPEARAGRHSWQQRSQPSDSGQQRAS